MFTSSVRRSVGVIVVALVVALAVWSVFRLLGVEPTLGRGPAPHPVGGLDVAVVTLVAGLGAWVVSARLTRRRLSGAWPFVGSTALAISIIGPNWLADGASAVSLICQEVAVAVVLVVGFAREPANSSQERQA